jgi:membrane associated rhomboid family serine protease
MRDQVGGARFPRTTLLLAIVLAGIAAAVQLHFGANVEFGGRSGAIRGLLWTEPERLFGAALMHFELSHLAWNLAGIVLAGALLESALGGAVVLNVALWGGATAMVAGLPWLEPKHTAVGASGMVYALFGAFLSWRALHPEAFGRCQRGAIPWAVVLLWTTAGLTSNETMPARAHFAGFAYGVAWGVLGPRVPRRWRRGFAALAVALCLVSEATLAWRALRREPAETARAMRVVLDGPLPAENVNNVSWYWAAQADAPRAVLELARDRMARLVAEEGGSLAAKDGLLLAAAEDTLATLYYRLGEIDEAIELERRLVLRDPALPSLHVFTSQLARFEHARLTSIASPSLSEPPLRLRRAGGEAWRLEMAVEPTVAVPRRALVLYAGRPAGYLEVDASERTLPIEVPAPAEGAPASEGAPLGVVPLQTLPNGAQRPTRLWWVDPEIAALP